jgi:hypothetical protein
VIGAAGLALIAGGAVLLWLSVPRGLRPARLSLKGPLSWIVPLIVVSAVALGATLLLRTVL